MGFLLFLLTSASHDGGCDEAPPPTYIQQLRCVFVRNCFALYSFNSKNMGNVDEFHRRGQRTQLILCRCGFVREHSGNAAAAAAAQQGMPRWCREFSELRGESGCLSADPLQLVLNVVLTGRSREATQEHIVSTCCWNCWYAQHKSNREPRNQTIFVRGGVCINSFSLDINPQNEAENSQRRKHKTYIHRHTQGQFFSFVPLSLLSPQETVIHLAKKTHQINQL